MSWKRLEAGGVDPNIDEGIAAAVADPVWFLARQWQVGEFRGEDAATPIVLEAEVDTFPVTKFWTEDEKGDRQTVARGQFGVPLETLAEREPITTGPAAIRLRLESGAALLRRLASSGVADSVLAALQDEYALTAVPDDGLDPVGHARLQLLARHALDAPRLEAAIAVAGGDPAALSELAVLADGPRAAAAAEIAAWQRQEAALFTEIDADAPSAWSARRLEYRFGVTAITPAGTIELTAPEYPGGRLDWQHFDVASVSKVAGPKPPAPATDVPKHIRVLPIPLQFAGMPAARWWEFEDGGAYFGDLAGGPEDLARSVVAAYSAVAGEDWFVVPCTLDVGTVAQVVSLRVLDDFEGWTTVEAAAVADASSSDERPWRWFELRGDPSVGRGQAPLLFLPPVVSTVEQGRPLEAVEFRRDEMANMAWAIERRVESTAGRPVDREAGPRPEPLPPPDDGAWRYQLATDVPDHWVPLVPVRINGRRPDVVLRRGRVAADENAASANHAKGRILEPERPFILCEEELPAGGLRVTRAYQLARSADGGVHLWTGRRKQPSGGPMARTPLHFDKLTTTAPRFRES
jgi:hypothetical protein